MSDPIAVIRGRVRELELEAVAIKARHQEATELLAQLEYGERRRGRPRKITVINMPGRIGGGVACAEADMPSLDDVQGILKPDGAAA